MPGHSGVKGEEKLFSASEFDWTEVEGLDNLLESQGVILDSEKLIAKSYGYKYSLMLTQGATTAMQIAVNVIKERSDTVIAFGDMHKSFWSACTLFGMNAVIAKDISDIEDIAKHNNIGAVFVTSPDYFGQTKDLSDLRQICDKTGALLVVDEAHSAHFVFSSLLPDNASKFADMSFVGMHKTLPVYGGGALININDKDLYEKCRRYRAMLHSTSPNYLIMASMDYARDYMERNGEVLYAELKDKVKAFANNLKTGEVVNSADFSRLVIKFKGKDCYDLLGQLADRGIFIEAAYGDRLVLIVTPFNKDKLNLIAEALDEVELKDLEELILPSLENIKIDSKQIISTEFVDTDNCLNRISAGEIGIYPPGVPVIRKGDIMSEDAVAFIKKYKNRLFGLASDRVAVIK